MLDPEALGAWSVVDMLKRLDDVSEVEIGPVLKRGVMQWFIRCLYTPALIPIALIAARVFDTAPGDAIGIY